MSNLTTEVFGDMNYLYEHIANRDSQQLNENSEYYDEEATELVADILATISSSMVYEGYSANAIITFLTTSSEQDIVEKYLSFDENILTESVVSEDYIIEQLEIFDYCIDEGLGSLIGKVAKGAGALAVRIATKPARMKVAQKMMTSKDPTKTAAAVDRLARMKMNKAGFPADMTKKVVDAAPNISGKTAVIATAPAIGKVVKGVQKVKDIAKGAKAALTSPTARNVGLTALGAGALVGLPYAGAKMAGTGSGQGPSPTGGKSVTPGTASNTDFMKGSTLAKLGGREGRIKDGEFRTMSWSQQSKERYNKAKGATTPPPAPKLPAPAGSGGGSGSGGGGKPAKSAAPAKLGSTSFERRTPTSAELKGAQDYRSQNPNAKPEDVLKAAQEAGKRQKSVDTDVAKFNKPEELNKPAPAGSALAGEQERRKAQATATQKESYDLVLEYLFDYGHADTLAEAEYLMTELDESFIQSLVETYEANILAEEVKAWVYGLVEEGYDLSEYTWDDMVDYYFSEAKYGTKKGRHELGLKIAHGKDVGKKGAGFEKIVNKASKKYGKKRATKIAAAAMWKNLGR